MWSAAYVFAGDGGADGVLDDRGADNFRGDGGGALRGDGSADGFVGDGGADAFLGDGNMRSSSMASSKAGGGRR